MKLIVGIIFLSVACFSYVKSPVDFIQKNSFNLRLDYSGYSLSQYESAVWKLDGVFRFNDIFFGILPRSVFLDGARHTETHFSVGWYVFENEDLKWLNWSTQVGLYSLGMSDHYRQNSLDVYAIDYQLGHLIQLKSWPLFVYWNLFMKPSGELSSGYVVGTTGNQQKLFFEYIEDSKQLYMGLDYRLSHSYSGVLAVNLMPKVASVSYPLVKLGIRLNNPFFSDTAQPKKKPLPVDEATFLLLEKALLAFNSQNYDSAANYYARVIQSYPEFVLPYIRLGNCYYQLKQWQMAKQAWSTALKLDPTNNDVFMALVRLKNREYQADAFIESSNL